VLRTTWVLKHENVSSLHFASLHISGEQSSLVSTVATVIQKSDKFVQDEAKQKEALKAVTQAALIASGLAMAIVAIIAIVLAVVSKDLDERVVEVIEGISKVVAAICILQLSTKVPKWLGLYAGKKKDHEGKVAGLSMKSIKFNVAWNIWREVAECGVFLFPFYETVSTTTRLLSTRSNDSSVKEEASVQQYKTPPKSRNQSFIFICVLILERSVGCSD